nr:MAG TPA: hypothetical protein [Caudoviricetes sp.]
MSWTKLSTFGEYLEIYVLKIGTAVAVYSIQTFLLPPTVYPCYLFSCL